MTFLMIVLLAPRPSSDPRRASTENKGDGERGRNRTFNLLIKSQLLCQLSYAPFSGLNQGPGTQRICSRVRAICLMNSWEAACRNIDQLTTVYLNEYNKAPCRLLTSAIGRPRTV